MLNLILPMPVPMHQTALYAAFCAGSAPPR